MHRQWNTIFSAIIKIQGFFKLKAIEKPLRESLVHDQGALFPVIYLWEFHLFSSRLFNKDCKFLVKNAQNRIGDWKNKSLSFAGILQLCRSVIRGFLWCNGELKRGKAKVAWNDICLPKSEGGLGIHTLEIFNIALMTTHIWNIVSNKESLWTGNGKDISAWFDVWCEHCPLIRFLSPRDFAREGLIPTPSIDDNKVDDLLRDSNGVMSKFSIKAAWEAFRPRDSNEHLLFKCSYASKMWVCIRHLAGMDLVPARLEDIMAFLQPIARKRSAISVIGRLLLDASSYYICIERNNRLFKQLKRSLEELHDIIMVTVRLKLLTFRFKNTTKVNELLSTWNIPNNFRLYED
ncbi:hypothetical protein Tco_0835770 [Tanacetum coccineum]